MSDRVRLIFTDNPGACMPEHKGAVFAVIGPFTSHLDKPALQDALTRLLLDYNRARQ